MAKGNRGNQGNNSTEPNKPTGTPDDEDGFEPTVTPESVEMDLGPVGLEANSDGTIGVSVELPVPGLLGVTASGGITFDPATGEIIETEFGAELGPIVSINVAIAGCEIMTTITIGIPNTPLSISYTIPGTMPNCEITEEEEEEEEELPPINPVEPELPPLPDIPDDEIVLIANAGIDYRYSYAPAEGGLREFKHYQRSTVEVLACWIPGITFYTHWRNDNVPTQGLFEIVMQRKYREYFNNGFQEEKEDTTRQQSLAGITLREFCDLAYLDSWQGGLFTSCHYGRWGDLKNKYYRDDQRKITRVRNQFTVDVSTLEPVLLHTFDKRIKPVPPAPPPELIMDNCCAASTRMLREIYEVLDPQAIKKTEIPKSFCYPGATGTIKMQTYDKILEAMMLQANLYGFQPFQAKVADANAGKEGSQPIAFAFNSLSGNLKF